MRQSLAIQLYTLREPFSKDPIMTLQTVREIGYEAVEFAGLANKSAAEIRACMDDIGLKGIAAHIAVNRLRDDILGVMEEAKTLGLEYVICPWLAPEWRNPEGYKALLPILRQASKALQAEGIGFGYHHHDFELQPVLGGKTALEFFAQEIPDLQFEPDVYWAAAVGLDPLAFLKSLAGRAPLVHLKEFDGGLTGSYSEVGSGQLDFQAILKTSAEIGVQWGIVEQDFCKGGPIESARKSYQYLSNLLKSQPN